MTILNQALRFSSFTIKAWARHGELLGSIIFLCSNLSISEAINLLSSLECSLDLVAIGVQSEVRLANSEIGGTLATATLQILRGGHRPRKVMSTDE